MKYGWQAFETAIGTCAIAWSGEGITGVALPERRGFAGERVASQFAGAQEASAPPRERRAIELIIALFRAERPDLSTVILDMANVPTFNRRVYEVTRAIPPGTTRTYGEVAREIGDPGASRAVGRALGENPFPIIVPCHRVLAAGGKSGGFSGPGGVVTKFQMLSFEGDGTFRFE